MNYSIHGPFEVPITGKNGKTIDTEKKGQSEFWAKIDESSGDRISSGCGCYVFCMRASKGVLPWYVGKAGKSSLKDESFGDHKLTHYHRLINDRKGTALLFLVVRRTTTGRLSKPSKNNYNDVDFLENLLITLALEKNPKLLNKKSTSMLRDLTVPGIINSPKGRLKKEANEFRGVFFATRGVNEGIPQENDNVD